MYELNELIAFRKKKQQNQPLTPKMLNIFCKKLQIQEKFKKKNNVRGRYYLEQSIFIDNHKSLNLVKIKFNEIEYYTDFDFFVKVKI